MNAPARARWRRLLPRTLGTRLALILATGLLLAHALSFALLFGERMLDAVSIATPDPRFGSLLAATLLFFVPTFFSGMISPYAVRLLVRDQASSGRHAGQLYFVSTFGSAAGTLLTSFYLVLLLEVNQILLSLLAVSGAIGVTAAISGKSAEAAQ